MIYYFGCWSDIGHHWRATDGRIADPPRQPFGPVDARYAPRAASGAEAPEGAAALLHLQGWTLLAFWDRSIDGRPGSNSAFLADATLGFEEMTVVARAAYPRVWARYAFAVALGLW